MAPSYSISPYCVAHPLRDGTGITVVHGLHGSRFELTADLLQLVVEILQGIPLERVLDRQPPEAREAIHTLLTEQILVERKEGPIPDNADPFRNRLDPIALAIHRAFNIGGYFPEMIDHTCPPAPEKDVRMAGSIDLEREPLRGSETLLEQSLRARRSIRSYAVRPMEKAELASFLPLTARAHAVIDTPDMGRLSIRNYPSGGARYPLEVYPIVYNVESLDSGIYYYHPFHHRLVAIESEPAYRDGLREVVRRMMDRPADSPGDPAVLLVVTAVFPRTCWKYQGIPYHLILQEVGALYQTMYLAATLLELAPCAVGAFPELAINELLHLNALDEAQVGLFALGIPAAATQPGLGVTELRLHESSPFSPDAHRRSVEFRFEDGRAEIRDLADVRLERHPNGRVFSSVMRGRHQVELTDDMAARLTAWLCDEQTRQRVEEGG